MSSWDKFKDLLVVVFILKKINYGIKVICFLFYVIIKEMFILIISFEGYILVVGNILYKLCKFVYLLIVFLISIYSVKYIWYLGVGCIILSFLIK